LEILFRSRFTERSFDDHSDDVADRPMLSYSTRSHRAWSAFYLWSEQRPAHACTTRRPLLAFSDADRDRRQAQKVE